MSGTRGISEDRRGTAPGARALVYIAYALPALPLAALALPLYVIVPTFYSEAIGLPVAAVGTVLLAIRVLDAATDPLFGWLADRWRGRAGRRRGFFLASLPLTAGSAFMLFWPSGEAGLGYLAFWAALVSIGFTWTSLPYTAWGAELSSDYAERTRISAFREGATLIGILLATSLPFSIGLTGGGGMHGLQAMAVLVAFLLPISGLAAVVLVPEPVNRSSTELGFFEGAAFMAANRPFLRLIAAFLLNGFANAIPATLFLYFVSDRLGAPDWRGPLLLVYFACAVLGVPLAVRAAHRFGKHRAWCGAMLATCPIFALSGFLGPGDVGAFVVICALTGLLLGFDLALPPSIQADVIDHDTARSGAQRSGLYFAAWSLATKLSLAAAVGLVFPLLALSGFNPQAGGSAPNSSEVLAMLYAWLPIVPKLAAIWLMWRFPIDRLAQRELLRQIGSGKPDPADPKALRPRSRGGST
ncbi:MFS transporter [Mycoplana rhizolycopersici]|uniref:MFS transporter n=1 Tax=Mycoplana rhizolycopersici TaxID=2746702 RepID=A0ABX2QIS9_9HYPH|nr:MFS transporter [Rhizobium rhizolycopersici]NVP57696.1 MFS transporter [Rhizobium rhizolycopersici]